MTFRFIPHPEPRRDIDTSTDFGRMLAAFYGPQECSECEREAAFFLVRDEDDGTTVWDGSSLCGGETDCVTKAIRTYGLGGLDPWDDSFAAPHTPWAAEDPPALFTDYAKALGAVEGITEYIEAIRNAGGPQ